MTTDDIAVRFTLARAVAREAGALALDFWARRATLTIETKDDPLDQVSQADRETEVLIRTRIADRFPNDALFGEEGGSTPGQSGLTWVIDPIDGTVPFVAGLPHWCVAIALQGPDGTELGVIDVPVAGTQYAARRGHGAMLDDVPLRISPDHRVTNTLVALGASHRTAPERIIAVVGALMARGGMFYRNGSGALMLADVAAGRLGGYYEPHMNAWDCLAGLLMIREAGGRTAPFCDTVPLEQGDRALAAAPGVWDDLIEIVAQAEAAHQA